MNIYFVISYPKSGATWFRLLMYALFHQEVENSNDVQEFYPELPTQESQVSENIEKGVDFFIKNHEAYSNGIKYLDKASKIIYIARNPFNCMLSKLDHYKYEGVNWVNNESGFNKFCNEFLDDANKPPNKTSDKLHGGWNYHIRSWTESELDIPVITIRYEDLTEDTFKCLKDLNQKMGWEYSDESIRKAVELASFDRIKELEINELTNKIPGMFYSEKRLKSYLDDNSKRFVKLGKKRDAIQVLPVETILRGKVVFYEGMKIAGYR